MTADGRGLRRGHRRTGSDADLECTVAGIWTYMNEPLNPDQTTPPC